MNRVHISIKGVVQGVGFRPFVYNLARSLNLRGYVTNTSDGVSIDIEGEDIHAFIERLPKEAPPLSKINNIEVSSLPIQNYETFSILESSNNEGFTLLSSDVSICKECLMEMLDPNDRRYLYPFINCVNCGPRYTITHAIPYDRRNTTMSVFIMCAECEKEYNDTASRRFHAQPNACPKCGPQLELKVISEKFKVDEKIAPIKTAIQLLKQGAIVAVKGLGGFHLACDATNKKAVERLRFNKRRNNKPFALMAHDIKTIENYCEISEEEKNMLVSNRRPIVLLKKRLNNYSISPLSESISPDNKYLGFMLPYTPLHYLLFYYPLAPHAESQITYFRDIIQRPNFFALVMTSGNISDEPIVTDNDEAVSKLSNIADAFLLHNRDIFMRTDDSVVRYSALDKNGGLLFIRRSRGYVPDPIKLNDDGPEVLGCGADIKNTFTLTKGNYAIPSQHIGDMENYETLNFFEESLSNLKKVYRARPVAIGYDLHPNYLSTKWALSQNSDIKFLGIQHHYAHIASVMAENGIKSKVLGAVFDGTGYGTDGTLWGGEFLIADIDGFKRAGHFRYLPLPGGEAAIREPWRMAISYIRNMAGEEAIYYLDVIHFIDRYGMEKINDVLAIIDKNIFSPSTTSCGRLFDSVSAILGICDVNTFEGEAAIALESYTVDDISDDYPVDIIFRDKMEIDFSMTIFRIIQDIEKGISKNLISTKFHNTIIEATARIVEKLSAMNRINDVVLSGGVFQNMYLLKNTIIRLKSSGLKVYINEKVPSNDAGISLGQAYIVRERVRAGI